VGPRVTTCSSSMARQGPRSTVPDPKTISSGAWGFTAGAFDYGLYGAPVKGLEKAGSRTSVYRFHLDSPITFTKSLRATIEHGHANHRSDDFFSVAYWYQAEPHAEFPRLPALEERMPKLHAVSGPGNAGTSR
jgi:hypothetical protein